MTNIAIGLMAIAQGTFGSTMVDSIPLRTALTWDSSAIEISLRDNSSTQMAWQETQTPRQQLDRIRTQLENLQSQLQQEREEVLQIEERVENAQVQLVNAGEILEREKEILDRIRPVVEQGAMVAAGAVAERELNRQEQQVLLAQNRVLTLELEIASLPEEIARSRSRIAALEAIIFRFADNPGKSNRKLRSTVSRIEDSERDDKRYRSKYNSLRELSPNVKESRIE